MTEVSKKEGLKNYDEKVGLDLKSISYAAFFWYGKSDLDSCCLAENRLMKGEKLGE